MSLTLSRSSGKSIFSNLISSLDTASYTHSGRWLRFFSATCPSTFAWIGMTLSSPALAHDLVFWEEIPKWRSHQELSSSGLSTKPDLENVLCHTQTRIPFLLRRSLHFSMLCQVSPQPDWQWDIGAGILVAPSKRPSSYKLHALLKFGFQVPLHLPQTGSLLFGSQAQWISPGQPIPKIPSPKLTTSQYNQLQWLYLLEGSWQVSLTQRNALLDEHGSPAGSSFHQWMVWQSLPQEARSISPLKEEANAQWNTLSYRYGRQKGNLTWLVGVHLVRLQVGNALILFPWPALGLTYQIGG
jgi:hypothetical protein